MCVNIRLGYMRCSGPADKDLLIAPHDQELDTKFAVAVPDLKLR